MDPVVPPMWVTSDASTDLIPCRFIFPALVLPMPLLELLVIPAALDPIVPLDPMLPLCMLELLPLCMLELLLLPILELLLEPC